MAWPLNAQGITPTDFIDLWLPVTQYLERRGLVRSNLDAIHGQHCCGGLHGAFLSRKGFTAYDLVPARFSVAGGHQADDRQSCSSVPLPTTLAGGQRPEPLAG
jgi:hypothetical protein